MQCVNCLICVTHRSFYMKLIKSKYQSCHQAPNNAGDTGGCTGRQRIELHNTETILIIQKYFLSQIHCRKKKQLFKVELNLIKLIMHVYLLLLASSDIFYYQHAQISLLTCLAIVISISTSCLARANNILFLISHFFSLKSSCAGKTLFHP